MKILSVRKPSWLVLGVVLFSLLLTCALGQDIDARLPKPTATDVIVQLFNWKFTQIQDELPALKKLGYTRVHVSPPMKSHDGDEWYFRYQPVDFTKIEGPLGTAAEFKALCDAANKPETNIGIIVDCVLNHMAEDPAYVTRKDGIVTNLQYPRFSIFDFHLPERKVDHDRLNGWLGLPDLKTESAYVRNELKNYLRMLVREYNVGGFRFDAAKHIETECFEELFAQFTPDERARLYIFGEHVSHEPGLMEPYLKLMKCYDFPLAVCMKEAFGWGGDLSKLVDPDKKGLALAGVDAVTFVQQHDIAMHTSEEDYRKDWDWVRIGGMEGGVDEKLAYVYILGRLEGTPYVYSSMPDYRKLRENDAADFQSFKRHRFRHREDPWITAGVLFHNLALRKVMMWRVQEKNQLAWQRGQDQFVAINKAGEPWKPAELTTSLDDGEYVDLLSKAKTYTLQNGKLRGLEIPPSSAVMLVKLLSAP